MSRLRYLGPEDVVVRVTSSKRDAIGCVAYVINVATGWSIRLVCQYTSNLEKVGEDIRLKNDLVRNRTLRECL